MHLEKQSSGLCIVYVTSISFLHLWCETCTMTSSSYVWGAVADRKGRKPVIITSCLLLGLFSAAFGFSVNFAMAVLFRLAVGLTNGKQCDVKYVGPTCTSIHFPSHIESVCCLSVSPSVCLLVCLSVCLFICHLKFIEGRTLLPT